MKRRRQPSSPASTPEQPTNPFKRVTKAFQVDANINVEPPTTGPGAPPLASHVHMDISVDPLTTNQGNPSIVLQADADMNAALLATDSSNPPVTSQMDATLNYGSHVRCDFSHTSAPQVASDALCVQFCSPAPLPDDLLAQVHAHTHAVKASHQSGSGARWHKSEEVDGNGFYLVEAMLRYSDFDSIHRFLVHFATVAGRIVEHRKLRSLAAKFDFTNDRGRTPGDGKDNTIIAAPWLRVRTVGAAANYGTPTHPVKIESFSMGFLENTCTFRAVDSENIAAKFSEGGAQIARQGSYLNMRFKLTQGLRFDLGAHRFVSSPGACDIHGFEPSPVFSNAAQSDVDFIVSDTKSIRLNINMHDVVAAVISPGEQLERFKSTCGLVLVLCRPPKCFYVAQGDHEKERETRITMGQHSEFFGRYVTYFLCFDSADSLEKAVSLVAYRSSLPVYYGLVHCCKDRISHFASEESLATFNVRVLLEKFQSECPWIKHFAILPKQTEANFLQAVANAGVEDGWATYFAYNALVGKWLRRRFAGSKVNNMDADATGDGSPADDGDDGEGNESARKENPDIRVSESFRFDLQQFILPIQNETMSGLFESFQVHGEEADVQEESLVTTKELHVAAQQATCDEHCGLVFAIDVTPTRTVVKEPDAMLLNRITRQFGRDASFLRIRFCDEDGSELNDLEVLTTLIDSVFDRGLTVGGRAYSCLGWSNSQMRAKGMWMFSSIDKSLTAAVIRDWVGDLDTILNEAGISKFASRFALAFSSTIPVFEIPSCMIGHMDDIERNELCFTDGVGWITEELASLIANSLSLPQVPCAYQVRFGGAKGVLVVNPWLKSEARYAHCAVVLRPSQVKFVSSFSVLEILDWAKPAECSLNQQIILLMLSGKVPEDAFLNRMVESLKAAAELVLNEDAALNFLQQKGFAGLQRIGSRCAGSDVRQFVSTRWSALSDPFLLQLLQLEYANRVNKLKRRTAIPIAEGRSLMGIADDYGVLRDNEIFVQISALDDWSDTLVIDKEVVISKNPCLHPGDVRRVRAVGGENSLDRPEIFQKLGHLKNVVVFPTKYGDRPLPDQMAGSDLDGDKYFVAWDTTFLPTRSFDPMDYTPVPLSSKDELKKEEDMLYRTDLLKHPDDKDKLEEYLRTEMREYYKRSCASVGLGVCANAHKVMADKIGADSEECIKLAQCHSDAVDFPKTGVPATISQELKPKEYPEFMEKEDKPTYKKETLLNKCWKQCPHVNLKRFFVAGAGGTSGDGWQRNNRNRRRRKNWRKQKCRTEELSGQDVVPSEHLLCEGCDTNALQDDAELHLKKYTDEVQRVITTYKVRNEAELFVDLDRQIGMSKKDRIINGKLVKKKMDEIRKTFLKELESSCHHIQGSPSNNQRAAAWYTAAYSQSTGVIFAEGGEQVLLGFGWIGDKYLMENLLENGKKGMRIGMETKLLADQHSGAFWVYESIGESVLDLWEDSGIAERVQELEKQISVWENGVWQKAENEGLTLVGSGFEGFTFLCRSDELMEWHLHCRAMDSPEYALRLLHSLDSGASTLSGKQINLPTLRCLVSFDTQGSGADTRDFSMKAKFCAEMMHVFAAVSVSSGTMIGMCVLPLAQLFMGWSRSVDLGIAQYAKRELCFADKYLLLVWLAAYVSEEMFPADEISLSDCRAMQSGPPPAGRCNDYIILVTDDFFIRSHLSKKSRMLGRLACGFMEFVSSKSSEEMHLFGRHFMEGCENLELWNLLRNHELNHFCNVASALFRASKQCLLERSSRSLAETGLVAQDHFGNTRVLRRSVHMKGVVEADVGSITTQFLRLLSKGSMTHRVFDQESDGNVKILHLDITTISHEEIHAVADLHARLQKKLNQYGSFCNSVGAELANLESIKKISNKCVEHLLSQSSEILQAIRTNQVVIIQAPTGGGKTTLIPLMLLNEAPAKLQKILVTENRRIATVAAAKRSIELMSAKVDQSSDALVYRLGREIGYQIGGDVQSSKDTELLFCIDAIAMMYALHNRNLPFTHIVIDEVHTRTVYCDVLLALLKEFHLKKNPQLKVVILSATAETSKLSRYFGSSASCKLLEIENPQNFCVEMSYIDQYPALQQRYWEAERSLGKYQTIPTLSGEDIADFIASLHAEECKSTNSTILVFLPGRGEIRDVHFFLNEMYRPDDNQYTWEVLTMFGGIPVEEQEKALQKHAKGSRLIVLATDVGESSITIPDCNLVIDSCLHRRMRQEPGIGNRQAPKLMLEYISKAEAQQRAGRTGRLADGKVVRLVPRQLFEFPGRLLDFPKPEIQTANVADILLLLQEHLPKFDTTVDVRKFLTSCLLDPLPPDQIEKGYRDLEEGGAIVSKNAVANGSVPGFAGASAGSVTNIGKLMKELYFNVEYVALIFNGLRYGVLEDCILLVAVYRHGSPFLAEDRFQAKDRLCLIDIMNACLPSAAGDALTKNNAVKAWRQNNLERWRRCSRDRNVQVVADRSLGDLQAEAEWCWDHYMDIVKLREIDDTCMQILDTLRDLGLVSPHFMNRVSKESLERRTRVAKSRDVRIRNNMYGNIAQAQAEIRRLLNAANQQASPQHAQLGANNLGSSEKTDLVLWCLASSFPSTVFGSTASSQNTQLTYTVRDPKQQKQQRHRRNFQWSPEERLHRFLSGYMGFGVQSIQQAGARSRARGDERDMIVTFRTTEDFNRARQLEDSHHYTKVATDAEVSECHTCWNGLRVILPAKTVCDLSGHCTIVVGETTATGNVILCHEVSVLPPEIGTAVLAVSNVAWPHCQFKGIAENCSWEWCIFGKIIEDANIRSVAAKIRRELDSEFQYPLEQRAAIVANRRRLVLDIIKYYRQAARKNATHVLQKLPVVIKEFHVKHLHKGKCPDSNAIGEILGKGGANITRHQLRSGCCIKVASRGHWNEGNVTLQGTREQINSAKNLLITAVDEAILKYNRYVNRQVDAEESDLLDHLL